MPASDEDYLYAGEWLSNRSDIGIVAIHASSFTKSDRLFNVLLARMKRIQAVAQKPLRFLVVGIAKPRQMRSILLEFDAIILNSRPVMEAMRVGNAYDENLKSFPAREMLRDQIILPNIIAFETFCNANHRDETEMSMNP